MPRTLAIDPVADDDPLLTAAESAKVLRSSRAKFYEAGYADEIESVRLGSRRFWRRSKVRAYIESCIVPGIKRRAKRPGRPRIRAPHAAA